MATINPVIEKLGHNATLFTYTLANGDDGAPIGPNFADYSDRSAQVSGTFGTGGNLKIEGSNNSTSYATLTDPQGSDLDVTAAKIKQIMERPRLTRPRVSAGDGTTAIVVALLVFRPRSSQEI